MTLNRDPNHVTSPQEFNALEAKLLRGLTQTPAYDRGEVHAQKVTAPEMRTRELTHQNMMFSLPETVDQWVTKVNPNLPWAEDHFRERVSGKPLNPPPAEAWWPYAQQGNAQHKVDEVFSHTYPERFWPKHAGDFEARRGHLDAHTQACEHRGIRFTYGDLDNLVDVLVKNPRSRQAYLPVWFPEDLTAATLGQRVPCTIGYHFLMTRAPVLPWEHQLDITYTMRSCDIIRFWRDDIYMAGRLLYWVIHELSIRGGKTEPLRVRPGNLILNIGSLHCFEGDLPHMYQRIAELEKTSDPRQGYNFGSML